MANNNYVTIIDNNGRNILGTFGGQTDTSIDIINPVMITVQPQNNQFQVQLIPLFLAEFISADSKGARNFTFTFSKSVVAVGKNFDIDQRITSQYDRIVEATNTPKQVPGDAKPEVIKLFDE